MILLQTAVDDEPDVDDEVELVELLDEDVLLDEVDVLPFHVLELPRQPTTLKRVRNFYSGVITGKKIRRLIPI